MLFEVGKSVTLIEDDSVAANNRDHSAGHMGLLHAVSDYLIHKSPQGVLISEQIRCSSGLVGARQARNGAEHDVAYDETGPVSIPARHHVKVDPIAESAL